MDHSAHEPGTVDGCPECRALSYEPGWYKALREEGVVGRRPGAGQISIPEAEDPDLEVVVAETPDPEVELPDLQETKREKRSR